VPLGQDNSKADLRKETSGNKRQRELSRIEDAGKRNSPRPSTIEKPQVAISRKDNQTPIPPLGGTQVTTTSHTPGDGEKKIRTKVTKKNSIGYAAKIRRSSKRAERVPYRKAIRSQGQQGQKNKKLLPCTKTVHRRTVREGGGD